MVTEVKSHEATELGRIPIEWNVVPLSDLFMEVSERKGDQEYPILSCTKDGIVFQSEHFNKRVASDDDSQYKIAKNGDIVISGLNLHLGGIDVQSLVPAGAVSPAYYVFRKTTNAVDLQFIRYLLRSEKYIQLYDTQITQIGASIVRRSTPRAKVRSLPVVVPPLSEQRKIAAILKSVDDAITGTQRIIDQTEVVKRGLMHKLLTKGIGHTKFKQTEIGEIPAEWDVVTVSDLTIEHKQGYYTKDTYTENGTYLIRITDLWNPKIVFEGMPKLPVDERTFELFRVEQGDFLFARSGASIGRYGIVSETDPAAVFASYLIRFKFNQLLVDNRYFGYFYESDLCWKQIKPIIQGSSNPNINANNIKSLKIVLPRIEEQKRIVARLTAFDEKLELERASIRNLEALKTGLIGQLLTGKLRVNFGEESEVSV